MAIIDFGGVKEEVVTREELLGPIAAEMEASGWGGFKYRAMLTRETFRAMDEKKLKVDSRK